MRILTINFHFAHNFGAVLQSLALQKVLEKMGHTVSVIDYRPDYMVQQYKPFPNPVAGARRAARDYCDSGRGYRIYREFRRASQYVLNYRFAVARMKRQQAFERFINNHLNVTQRSYRTICELRNDSPKADIYLAGSDQIWNPYVTNAGLDEAYFLCFGDDTVRRASYAASPCQLDVKRYAPQLREYLGKFSHISLREREKQAELSHCLNREIEVCLDPTLLLTADDYRQYESEAGANSGRYIAAYVFVDKTRKRALQDTLIKAGKILGLPIVDLSLDPVRMPQCVQKGKTLSPADFLAYIKNAEFVITNSFHGTAFSIVYHKRFLTMSKTGTASRTNELLTKLGLDKRLLKDDVDLEKAIMDDIAYRQADSLLQTERQHSMEFLERVCSER